MLHDEKSTQANNTHALPSGGASETTEQKRARYHAFQRRVMDGLAQSHAESLAWFESAVGPEVFAELFHDREAAVRALEDGDPKRRRCALYLLVEHWKLVAEHLDRCEALAFGDPDEAVRRTAIAALTGHYRKSNHLRIGWLLARVVRAEPEPLSVRFAAYLGLLRLRGGTAVPGFSQDKLLEQADWAFVDSFLAAGKEAPPGHGSA